MLAGIYRIYMRVRDMGGEAHVGVGIGNNTPYLVETRVFGVTRKGCKRGQSGT